MTTLSLPAPAHHRRNEPVVPAVHSEDDTLVLLLVSTWELYTGRTLRNAPAAHLTEQELIEFWTDDRTVDTATTTGGR
jgi:hypothetical protein